MTHIVRLDPADPAVTWYVVATVINALSDAPHDAGVEPHPWDGARVDERWNGPGRRFGFREYAVAAVHDAAGETGT